MAEHLSTEIIELYRRGELRGKKRFEADIHLAACRRCSELAGQKEMLQFAYEALRSNLERSANLPIEHLSGEQIADHINGKLDRVEFEIVTSHLAWCSDCREDVNDVRAFARQLATGQKRNVSFLLGLKERVSGLVSKIPQPRYQHAAGVLAVLTVAAASFGLWRLSDSGKWQAETPASTIPRHSPDEKISPTPPNNSPTKLNELAADALPQERIEKTPERLAWMMPADRLLFNEAMRKQQLPIRSEIALARRQAKQMSEADEKTFALHSPSGGAIREVRPQLKWLPFKDSVKYKILLVDKTDKVTLPDTFVVGLEWRPDFELQRGHRYVWHVVAISKEGEEKYGRWMNRSYGEFVVLTDPELLQVDAAEKHYRSSNEPLAQIALAVSYAKVGLVDDAERELVSYLKVNPNSTQAQKMLESLRAGGSR
ncbi:MAG: hypothetical protein SF097_14245 [Acidobacteriota bacterium]|nr:hypothetical protein [Acidobacteriota bacterium]